MKKAMIPPAVIAVFFLTLVVAICAFVLTMLLQKPPTGRDRELRVKLLYRTDHKALRDACRELSQRTRVGRLEARMYHFGPNPDPQTAEFPRPILDLMPVYVTIDADGSVMVAMMGGLDHFGVVAYPEDYKKPAFDDFKFGDMQLIEGLWYYDDGYETRPADWQQRIDALKPNK
jgi:hypothetical protein